MLCFNDESQPFYHHLDRIYPVRRVRRSASDFPIVEHNESFNVSTISTHSPLFSTETPAAIDEITELPMMESVTTFLENSSSSVVIIEVSLFVSCLVSYGIELDQ